MPFELTDEDLAFIDDALDSHVYWQLSDRKYRADSAVRTPGSDDPENAAAIARAVGLRERIHHYFNAQSNTHHEKETA